MAGIHPNTWWVVRPHIQRNSGVLAGKALSLWADDPDGQGWRYRVMLTN
jgi:hypothetical protein